MNDLENYLMDKHAETSGTPLMPNSAPTYSDRNANPTKTIRKVGEAAPTLETNEEGVSGEQVKQLPQAAQIGLRVDVSGKEAPTPETAKAASYYALPSHGRYPLDSYAQVKTAAAYFDEYRKQMSPELRHEYCSNLVKRASMLGIEVSDYARKYGADTYAPDAHVHSALDMRIGVIKEAAHLEALEQLRQCKGLMAPEDFAVTIGEFDKIAGIDELYDRDVPDPYWTTFGEKKAEDEGAILVGNDYIPAKDLKHFSKTNADKLIESFGQDFVDEFRKDPVAVTKSLPVDQRKMVIRLAASTLTDPTTT